MPWRLRPQRCGRGSAPRREELKEEAEARAATEAKLEHAEARATEGGECLDV